MTKGVDFGRFLRFRPATHRPPLVSCPRATDQYPPASPPHVPHVAPGELQEANQGSVCLRATQPPADGPLGPPPMMRCSSRLWLSLVGVRAPSSEFPRKTLSCQGWEPPSRNPVVSVWLPSRRNSGTLPDRYRQVQVLVLLADVLTMLVTLVGMAQHETETEDSGEHQWRAE
jgi:hypothetical protein